MRERQAAQLAAALILKAGRAIGVVRLMKLMYLAEREAMRRSGLPMVFDDIYAMREGHIEEISTSLQRLQRYGFRLSSALIETALAQAHEQSSR